MNFKNFLEESTSIQDANTLQYAITKELGRKALVKDGKLHVSGYANEAEEKAGAQEIQDHIAKLKKTGKLRSANIHVDNDHATKSVVVSMAN